MQNITSIIEDMMHHGIPEDRAVKIAAMLLQAGEQAVYARIGEISGHHVAKPEDIGMLLAGLIAA